MATRGRPVDQQSWTRRLVGQAEARVPVHMSAARGST